MTPQLRALAPVEPNPLVLLNRERRSDVPQDRLSRYNDDTWDLTAGMFEEHSTKTGITFKDFPERWQPSLRRYFWLLINDQQIRPVPGASLGTLSLQSISLMKSTLVALFRILDDGEVQSLDQLDDVALDALAVHLSSEFTFETGRRILTEVRRLWANRDLVPAPLKMRPQVPWAGDRATDLLTPPPVSTGAKTKRIADETLVPLMAWSIRFVTDFGADILGAYHQYCDLIRIEYRHRPDSKIGVTRHDIPVRARIQRMLRTLKGLELGLPGQREVDGQLRIRWAHLGRLAKVQPQWAQKYHSDLIETSGLHIDDNAYLTVRCEGRLDGAPWRSKPIPWDDVIDFATLLQTACFLTIAYLSGMRPGEVLGLQRGCASFDAELGIWKVSGSRWKSVRTASGEKATRGEIRENPWIVHPLAAQAISLLEDLHDETLLFPNSLRPRPVRGFEIVEEARPGGARTSSQIGTDLAAFTSWVNAYAAEHDRQDSIPNDPAGRLNPRRLRRTLAWHIVRRPRGLVAAAIQYGHLATAITQGYAGDRASGFPNEVAFERWLERFERLSGIASYAETGGQISGPAAAELVRRAKSTVARFEGRVVPTFRQAESLLKRPDMQVYEGEGMHCVFTAATALCLRDGDGPALGDCRTGCTNIARTDADIATLDELRMRLAADTLAPPIRHRRTQQIIGELTARIQEHGRD